MSDKNGIEYVQFRIDNYEDRQNMIRALANAGYKVWAKGTHQLLNSEFYVCVEKP